MPQTSDLDVPLPSGTLHLSFGGPPQRLHELLAFAVRRNPRRGFLFVSRVLGKHIPVSPQAALATHRQLAALLPPLSAPHFIGLAETATALGEGVYRAWKERTGAAGGSYQHTTRYRTRHPLLLSFDEPHSHAPAHLLYDPGEAARHAKELVLIDDELSTGTTLLNLAREWRALHPWVRRVVLVSLTDWCGQRATLEAALGVPTEFVSLLRGAYAFTPASGWAPAELPAVTGNGGDKSELLPARSARYGHSTDVPTPAELGLTLSRSERVLVLGSGEYQYPAFALAHQLAPEIADCQFCATTRSPVLPGLAIEQHLSFGDSVEDGIPNYLYNVVPADYTRILVCSEGRCTPDPALMRALGPRAQALNLDARLDSPLLSTAP
ncbi:phosphoribosyltransferase domain-containing protein [Deinococcus sp.]|uniref:phosphoribosyltransferase domain-containing protein n=1 Tax=Deinococcus sp. TaxID=47478 RepID=UPI003CC58D2F